MCLPEVVLTTLSSVVVTTSSYIRVYVISSYEFEIRLKKRDVFQIWQRLHDYPLKFWNFSDGSFSKSAENLAVRP